MCRSKCRWGERKDREGASAPGSERTLENQLLIKKNKKSNPALIIVMLLALP